MKKILLHELNQLPAKDQLDCSNDRDRNRLHSWIIDLTYIENFGTIGDPDSEINLWYEDKCWNPLCDYDLMLDEFKEYEEILLLATQLQM